MQDRGSSTFAGTAGIAGSANGAVGVPVSFVTNSGGIQFSNGQLFLTLTNLTGCPVIVASVATTGFDATAICNIDFDNCCLQEPVHTRQFLSQSNIEFFPDQRRYRCLRPREFNAGQLALVQQTPTCGVKVG